MTFDQNYTSGESEANTKRKIDIIETIFQSTNSFIKTNTKC